MELAGGGGDCLLLPADRELPVPARSADAADLVPIQQ